MGAVAQSIPDIDFITTFWLDDADDIINHRGITHSFLFAIMATFILAAVCRYFFRSLRIGWQTWFLLFGLNIMTHLFIDSLNAYGIGWLEPFSPKRFSFHVLFVADPLFSIWPFFACMAFLFMRRTNKKRKVWRWIGMGIPLLYTLLALVSRVIVQNDIKKDLHAQGLSSDRYLVTPTPFNSLLWFVAARDSGNYYVTHRSVFDKKPTRFTVFPQNAYLASEVKNQKALQDMIVFADHFYTMEKLNDTIVLYVLRFGQMVGWHDPQQKFCFYYYCDRPGANEIVTQRGRFRYWNRETLASFLRRIGGK
jgi:inner membrane protein